MFANCLDGIPQVSFGAMELVAPILQLDRIHRIDATWDRVA